MQHMYIFVSSQIKNTIHAAKMVNKIICNYYKLIFDDRTTRTNKAINLIIWVCSLGMPAEL